MAVAVMSQLDAVSEAIGALRSDVRSMRDNLEEAIAQMDTIHDNLEPRVRKLETGQARRDGKFVVAGTLGGAISGGALALIGKWVAAKMGI